MNQLIDTSVIAAMIILTFFAPDPVRAAPPLDIMVEDAAAPQSQKDGTGQANDIVRAAFAAAGVDVNLVVVPYTRCKALVMVGTLPACFSMSWDPQFQHTVVFSEKPIFTVEVRYFRNASASPAIRTESDIPRGAVVGLVNGYEYPASLERLREKGVIFEYANTEALNLRKLSAGRIDFAVLNLTNIKTEAGPISEAGVSNVVYAFSGDSMGSYIGFSALHPQGAAARAQFNRGHAAIIADGTVDKINQQWTR